MRIAIATVQVPFVRGGAEALAQGLAAALAAAGHDVEIVSAPFRFGPAVAVARSMRFWQDLELDASGADRVDAVLCLQFPTYYLSHPNKRVWLVHQHRAAYWPPDVGAPSADELLLSRAIRLADTHALGTCGPLRSIAKTVSARLLAYNGLLATPLYHPPPLAAGHYCGDAGHFVLCPSRLVWHKRQHLFLDAMRETRSGLVGMLAGDGPLRDELEHRIEREGLADKVVLLGRVSSRDLLALYAQCSAVFYGPYDEDYGYVALEAMLSAKPIITCRDSGGPVEFVVPDQTGFVTDPSPESVAAAIDRLAGDRSLAADMGRQGRQRYHELIPSWETVVEDLVEWT